LQVSGGPGECRDEKRGDRSGPGAQAIARRAEREHEHEVIETDHRMREAGNEAFVQARRRGVVHGVMGVSDYRNGEQREESRGDAGILHVVVSRW
jgi:hypothetical protein